MDSIAYCVWQKIRAWPALPAALSLGRFPKEPPGMMLQPLSGAPYEKRFVDGSCVRRWPFAVTCRVNGAQTHSRLEAADVLSRLGEWLSRLEAWEGLPKGLCFVRAGMDKLPQIAAAFNNGVEDYMAVYSIVFKQAANGWEE